MGSAEVFLLWFRLHFNHFLVMAYGGQGEGAGHLLGWMGHKQEVTFTKCSPSVYKLDYGDLLITPSSRRLFQVLLRYLRERETEHHDGGGVGEARPQFRNASPPKNQEISSSNAGNVLNSKSVVITDYISV